MPARTVVFQHFTFPCLGHLGEFLDASGVHYECNIYSEISDEVSDALVEANLLILAGSPSSVNDDVMWVSEARKVVRR